MTDAKATPAPESNILPYPGNALPHARDAKLWGAVTALYEIMEAAWVALARETADPAAALRATREQMIGAWTVPTRDVPGEDEYRRIREHGLHFLRTFWDRCEDQVRTGRGDGNG